MSTLIVNLFGVPGAGKSTGAAYIFSQLKLAGVNAELVTEFAKDKVWEESNIMLENQAYIFGEQSFRLSRCAEKVDVIITDSPLPLNILYNHDKRLSEHFNETVMDVFNSYKNKNYLLFRVKPYNQTGRLQTESDSNALAAPISDLLRKYQIPYTTENGDLDGYTRIVNEILSELNIEK